MTTLEAVGLYDAWQSFDNADGYRAMAREAGQAVTSFHVRRQFVDGDTVCEPDRVSRGPRCQDAVLGCHDAGRSAGCARSEPLHQPRKERVHVAEA
jgi:hypothetical protein